MKTKLTQTRKKLQHKSQNIIASILTAILITGCQTTGSKQNHEMAHVITEQEILIDTIVAERGQAKVKSQVAKSEALTTAEVHLAAALNALKHSSQALKEAMKNEQH